MRAKTQAVLLATARAALDPDYYDGLMAGDGGEILEALAAQAERVSLAAKRAYDGLTAGTAPYGAYATGTVRLTRTGAAAGALGKGSVLTDLYGEPVALLADATWAGGNTDPVDVAIVSLRQSYQANLIPDTVLSVRVARAVSSGGALGAVGVVFDTTVLGVVLDAGVAGGGAATGVGLSGGVPPLLEAHARDNGLARQPDEPAARLRKRIRELDDTVSLAAVERQARAEVAGAQVYEIHDTCWAVGLHHLSGTYDLSHAFAGRRIHARYWPINHFMVGIPVDMTDPANDVAAVGVGVRIAAVRAAGVSFGVEEIGNG